MNYLLKNNTKSLVFIGNFYKNKLQTKEKIKKICFFTKNTLSVEKLVVSL